MNGYYHKRKRVDSALFFPVKCIQWVAQPYGRFFRNYNANHYLCSRDGIRNTGKPES